MADLIPVTDPDVLGRFSAPQQAAPQEVTDPDVLARFSGQQQTQAPTPTLSDSLFDAAKTVPFALARGASAVAGLPGLIRDAVNAGADRIMPLPPEGNATLAANKWMLPNPQQITNKIENVTGPLYQPQTTTGKYVNSIAEMAPAALMGPGSLLSKATSAIGAGVGSEAAGQATAGSSLEPYARIGGAIAGGSIPSIAARAVTPIPVSAARQQAIDTLANNGVTSLTAGQKTGNVPLRYSESFFGDAPFSGGKAQAIQDEGRQQFTKAATSRAGMTGLATPDELQANYQRLGNEFKTLSNNNTLKFDQQFAQDLQNTLSNYATVPGSQQGATVNKYINDIVGHAANGPTMPGVEYQKMRSRLSAQSQRLAGTDPDLSNALKGIRDALDNAMGRSISPQDQAAWQTARQQYGAQQVLQNAASRAGDASAEGYITPQNLRSAIAAGKTQRGAYARGQGQFADLARAGNVIMSPLPNSGTAQRHLLEAAALGLGGGGMEAFFHGVSPETAAVAGTGLLAPGMIGRGLFSKPVQSYLSNQLLGQPSVSLAKNAQRAGLLSALMQASRPPIPSQSN